MRCRLSRKLLTVLIGMGVVAAISACVGIFAQDQPKPDAAKPASAKPAATESAHIQYKWIKGKWGSKGTWLLKGVACTYKDTLLSTEEATYDEQAKTIVSPGKLTIGNPECDVTGDKGTAFLQKRLSVLEGNVVMLVKPKKTDDTKVDKDSVKAKFNEQTTILCPKLEYLYKDKIATATGGVVFKQAKRSASADKAVYDQNNEILTLTGNVKGVDEEGQTFAAPSVKISLKKGDEWMEAEHGNASFKVDLDEEKK